MRFLIQPWWLLVVASAPCLFAADRAGWGVDGGISTHASAEQVDDYIRLVRTAKIAYVRERDVQRIDAENWKSGRLAVFRKLSDAGFRIVAFIDFPQLRPIQVRNQLKEDLLEVYKAAYDLSKQAGGLVAAWEMVGEPDTFYCRDLPERVAAYQKAVYLGLKDGNAAAGVLMGALGNGPTPWLSRAAANGLYDYTDGLNIHFYGVASDLPDVIRAQRLAAARYTLRPLPLWITECGMNAAPAANPGDPHARELQRKFTVDTARTALKEGAAIFMPYILVGRRWEGESLTKSPGEPYPAWTAYADFVNAHPLRDVPALDVPADPSRIVLQWLPDRGESTPQKVAGSYWFRGGAMKPLPVTGAILAYNFSSRSAEGNLRIDAPSRLSLEVDGRRTSAAWTKKIRIAPNGVTRIPIRVAVAPGRYFRGDIRAVFDAGKKSASRLVFGFETEPSPALLRRVFPLVGERSKEDAFSWIWAPEPFQVTSQEGPWLGLNGVKVTGGGTAKESLSQPRVFEIVNPPRDPRVPPMAVTRVAGLPDSADGFLRLSSADVDKAAVGIRVDLVDKHGQRFSISENFGRNRFRYRDGDDVYLAYRDFHIYQWGRCAENPGFHPADVREIQLRFFPSAPRASTKVSLDVVAPGPQSGS
jgi:hypothetical protein